MEGAEVIREFLDKVQEEEASSTWQVVPPRKGRRPRPPPADPSAPKPKTTSSLLSKEEIALEHSNIVRAYKDSPEIRILVAIVNKIVTDKIKKCAVFLATAFSTSGTATHGFRKAMCLGIGSLADAASLTNRRTHIQYLAFCTIVAELQRSTTEPLVCIVQEPVFTSSDRDFITSMGHQVVQSPAAFDAVDSTTFVFGIHLYREVYAQVFKNGKIPGLFIGTGWDVWSDVCYQWTPEERSSLKLLEDMESTHSKIAFPEVSGNNYFHGTSIYWD